MGEADAFAPVISRPAEPAVPEWYYEGHLFSPSPPDSCIAFERCVEAIRNVDQWRPNVVTFARSYCQKKHPECPVYAGHSQSYGYYGDRPYSNSFYGFQRYR